MAKNPIDTAQQAWAAFQAGDVGTAHKLATRAFDQGEPFARTVEARLHRVIGAGVRGAADEAKRQKAEAAEAKKAAAAKKAAKE